jgi:PleD family two-component response regulator
MHENSPIQFIISDWEMADGHGIELLQYVRTMAVFKHIPFLMLTSLGKKELVLKAIQNGVSDFLLKPWEKDILESKLKSCLEKSIENKNKTP